MLTQKVQELIATNLKKGDEVALNTYRMLATAFNYASTLGTKHELSAEEEIEVVKKEAKKRKDAIEAYEKAGLVEKAQTEKNELKLLEEFLPSQMSDEDLEKIVDSVITNLKPSGMQDMGKVIGAVMGKVKESKGNVDGSRVSALVKTKLS